MASLPYAVIILVFAVYAIHDLHARPLPVLRRSIPHLSQSPDSLRPPPLASYEVLRRDRVSDEPRVRSDRATAGLFDVTAYGAKGDGKTESTKAFLSAWRDACNHPGKSTLLIPPGIFYVGPLLFDGPCHHNQSPKMVIRGTLRAPSDVSVFLKPNWIVFHRLHGLIINGEGNALLDGQGKEAWQDPSCQKKSKCDTLPRSLRFEHVSNGTISNIALLNSKGVHVSLLRSTNIILDGLNVTAPWNSPNTDGIHVGDSTNIKIVSSTIGTGDDCVSIGPGSFNVSVFNTTCGPGHGISIGSLGQNEKNVGGIKVRNCTIVGTQNGLRIKTWPGSPPSKAFDMTFEDVIMIDVPNPIIIDQEYCPSNSCHKSKPSLVQLSDIAFRNITGTARTTPPVTINCSKKVPCRNVTLEKIDLKKVKHGEHGRSLWSFIWKSFW
ncbi:hypothetical protein Ancab_016522 [Ancistrocladus abbreviatus]